MILSTFFIKFYNTLKNIVYQSKISIRNSKSSIKNGDNLGTIIGGNQINNYYVEKKSLKEGDVSKLS